MRKDKHAQIVLARQERVTTEDVAAALMPARTAAPALPETSLDAPDHREARRLFEIAYLTHKFREHGADVTWTAAAIGNER